MSSSLTENQNFEHNIKQEPEEEFLCILPNFNSEIVYERQLINVKQESEIQSRKLHKFQCKICQKIIATNQGLRKHEKTHQKQQCKICNRKIPSQSFEKHMRSHQNEKSERKFECKFCFYKFLTNKQLLLHVLRHSKRFQCDLCGHFSASLKHNLMVHLTLHLVQDQYKCIFCRELFDDRESFRFHSRQIHGDPKNRNGLTKADLLCRTCGKEFCDVQNRKKHEKSHGEKVQCPVCDKKCQPSGLKSHLKMHELEKKEKNFICDICSKSFLTKANLEKHKRIHNKLKCDICGYENAIKNIMKHHLESHFGLYIESFKLSCNVCHLECRNLSALKNHQFTHKASKTCPTCSKSIKPQCFLHHINLHELKKGEKKFECKICRKKSYTKSNLNHHMKMHNKRYECDLCEYRAGQKGNLKFHIAKHMQLERINC